MFKQHILTFDRLGYSISRHRIICLEMCLLSPRNGTPWKTSSEHRWMLSSPKIVRRTIGHIHIHKKPLLNEPKTKVHNILNKQILLIAICQIVPKIWPKPWSCCESFAASTNTHTTPCTHIDQHKYCTAWMGVTYKVNSSTAIAYRTVNVFVCIGRAYVPMSGITKIPKFPNERDTHNPFFNLNFIS